VEQPARFSQEAVDAITNKDEALTQNINSTGWTAKPMTVLTDGARGTTHIP